MKKVLLRSPDGLVEREMTDEKYERISIHLKYKKKNIAEYKKALKKS